MHSNRLIRLEYALDSFYENPFVGPILMALFFMPQEYAIGAIAFKVWQYAQMIVFLVSFITILVKRVKYSLVTFVRLFTSYFIWSHLQLMVPTPYLAQIYMSVRVG